MKNRVRSLVHHIFIEYEPDKHPQTSSIQKGQHPVDKEHTPGITLKPMYNEHKRH